MTTIHELIRKYNHCGCLNKFNVVTSTITSDLPDLDTSYGKIIVIVEELYE